jgi:adenylosuccinate lyase
VAEAVSRGQSNDLLDRLAADPAFRNVPADALRAELEPARYTGRAAQQVEEFLTEHLAPLRDRARPLAADADVAEVKV